MPQVHLISSYSPLPFLPLPYILDCVCLTGPHQTTAGDPKEAVHFQKYTEGLSALPEVRDAATEASSIIAASKVSLMGITALRAFFH